MESTLTRSARRLRKSAAKPTRSTAISPDEAIAAAETQAKERAVAAGADPAGLATVDVEDMPLSYLPGNALRVRVRVAGEMRGPRQ